MVYKTRYKQVEGLQRTEDNLKECIIFCNSVSERLFSYHETEKVDKIIPVGTYIIRTAKDYLLFLSKYEFNALFVDDSEVENV